VLVRRGIAALATRALTLPVPQARSYIVAEGRLLPAPFFGFEPTRGPPLVRPG
jgi:hypothetical protein